MNLDIGLFILVCVGIIAAAYYDYVKGKRK